MRFTSTRERNLWLWAGAAVFAIYTTLGIAGELAGWLAEPQLVNFAFFLGFLIVIAAVIASGLLNRPGWQEIWAAVGVTAVFAMILTRSLAPAERTHLFEYSLVAVLIYHALKERTRSGARIPAPALLAFLITTLLGWLDEGIQALLPNRVYDLRDVAFNTLAALLAVITAAALTFIRRKTASQSPLTPP